MTREDYLALFDTVEQAERFENLCLSGPLPQVAQRVLYGGCNPDVAYWQWLADEWADLREGG